MTKHRHSARVFAARVFAARVFALRGGSLLAASLLAVCLLVCGLAASTAWAAKEDMTLLRAREGAAALMRGQYQKAVDTLDQVLSQPDISDFIKASIYSDRGVAKWRMKETKAAIEDFNKSIAISPENAIVYNNRGNALLDLHQPAEAVKDFDRAIALSPNYGVAYNNRGNAREALDQPDAAFQDYRKAVELMPTSAVPLNGRGKAHAALKRYHAAIRDFTKAISLNPACEDCYANRGAAYLAIEKYDLAVADFTQALKLKPEQPKLLVERAKAYAGAKRYRQARADLDQAIKLKPDDVQAYLERGKLLTTLNLTDDALADLTHAIQLAPSAKAYALRAEAKLKANQPDDALTDANQALSLAANNAYALRVRGDVYNALDREDDAIADYRHALQEDPFQDASREALVALNQEVPVAQGAPLGPPIDGWVVQELEPARYVATDPDYPAIRAQLEMFGSGKPKILQWDVLDHALKGIGLLRYYAGDAGTQGDDSLIYVAIIDLWANKVVSIEPYSWGDRSAEWNWGSLSVAVTDPDGNAEQVRLRKPKPVAAPTTAGGNYGRRQRRGGGGGGLFRWLFQ